MSTRKPIIFIELWVRVQGRWEHVESFDPASPQFNRSRAPAEHAWFEAKRQGASIVKAEPQIETYDVRRARF